MSGSYHPFKPCPDCDYDELEWREACIETHLGDADVERIRCRHCEAEFYEHEICKQCGKWLPLHKLGRYEFCSAECVKEYQSD